MRLQGKLALITGASSGIGEACARRFAAEGAGLILWARRADRLDHVAREITAAHGCTVHTAIVDVRDRAAVEAEVERTVATAGVPDILVNNAGLAAGFTVLHEGDPEDWDRMIDTNVKGLLYVSRAVIPHMVSADRGHVINIGSTAAHTQYPKGNVYAATKFAVRALSEGMSVDTLGSRIRISQIDPGLVETEFSVVRFHGDDERAKKVYEGIRPLTGDDIAETVAYVAGLPEYMNILDLVVVPTPQRNITTIDRREAQ
ncbi:MAG: SDR family NAD(P)-dependent oxidoreductase [Longimicrobiales bacterium]